MRSDLYTKGSIPKGLLMFAGPYVMGMVLQNLYGAVDLLVVGHFATTADVSAVTIGSQILSMSTQLIVGLATGVTVLIGRYFGAKSQKEMARTTGTAATALMAFALVVTVAFLLLTDVFVALMQTPGEAIRQTGEYIFFCSIGIVFIVAYNVISSILMGLGDTQTPFLFILAACIINIVLDVVLVSLFGMGALGAAIATTAAQAGSVLFSLLYLRRKGLGFPLAKEDFRPRKSYLGRILTIGGPVAVQNALVGASFLFITAIINQMGLIASASVGVVEKIIGFLFMPAVALGSAVATISAQNIGAGQRERALKSLWYGIGIALIPSLAVTVFCQFGGSALTSLFSTDAQVIQIADLYLRSYVWDCVLVCFVFSMNGYFNSNGQSWFTLAHSLLTTFTLRVPLTYLFSRVENVTLFQMGWAAPASTLASLLLCIAFLLWTQRRKKAPAPVGT